MAITLWAKEEKEKGGFKLLHCYQALKNSPKWTTEVVHPIAIRSTPAYSSVNICDNGSSFGHVEIERPIGRKAEKENKRKRKMRAEDNAESQAANNIRDSHELMERLHSEKMMALLEDTRKMDVLVEMKKEKLELDRKTYQDNIERREEKLMAVDMAKLSELQRKYFEMKQAKIFEKAFNKDV